MKQPMIHVVGTNGQDFGDRKVVALHWDREGSIYGVAVEFAGEMFMGKYHLDIAPNPDQFTNSYGNLIGTLKA